MKINMLWISRHIRFITIFILIFSLFVQYSCKRGTGLSITLEEKYVLEGDGKTPFYEPGGIVVDKQGKIYVADSGNQRVVIFNSEGKFVKSFGRKGQGPGEFTSPWQLAVFGNEIYVYDWGRNIQKFNQNGEYISGFNLRGGTFLDFDIDSKGYIYIGRWTYGKDKFLIEKAIELEHEKIKILSDIPKRIDVFFDDLVEYNHEAVEKVLKKQGAGEVLEESVKRLANMNDFSADTLEKVARDFAAEKQLGTGKVFHPLRVAVSGRTQGPSLFHMKELLGKEKVIKRINDCLGKCF